MTPSGNSYQKNSVRQFFFAENRPLPYGANYHYCKDNENYGLLHSQVAQQCLKSVDEAISGFFKLLAMKKEGKLGVKVSFLNTMRIIRKLTPFQGKELQGVCIEQKRKNG